MRTYHTTFWLGIPKDLILNADGSVNDTHMRYMKEANFTIIAAQYDTETNKKVLKAAEEYGFVCTVIDSRMDDAVKDPARRESLLREIVADYKDYPALYDYYVFDEPNTKQYPALGDVVRILKELDPVHPGYINLFPNYATPEQRGVPTYEEYVDKYIREVDPKVVSWDHYHFMDVSPKMKKLEFANERSRMIYENAFLDDHRAEFYDNMQVVRDASLAAGKPYMNIVLLLAHGPYRDLNDAEMRLEAFQTLCYGCTYLSWFTYDTGKPGGDWNHRHGMIQNGERTPHYYMAAKINAEFLAMGDEIGDRKSVAVFHGTAGDANTTLFDKPFGGVESFEGNATIGFFEDDYVVIANKDFAGETAVSFKTVKQVEIFDRVTKVWATVKNANFTLPAGDCLLARLK